MTDREPDDRKIVYLITADAAELIPRGQSGVSSLRGQDVHDRQARAILEARVEAGGELVVGQEADWASIKSLQIRCHEAGIPTVLGNCPSGG